MTNHTKKNILSAITALLSAWQEQATMQGLPLTVADYCPMDFGPEFERLIDVLTGTQNLLTALGLQQIIPVDAFMAACFKVVEPNSSVFVTPIVDPSGFFLNILVDIVPNSFKLPNFAEVESHSRAQSVFRKGAEHRNNN